MQNGQVSALILAAATLTACTHNVANVRTFAGATQVVTGDTPGIVLADESNCEQNSALQEEFKKLEKVDLAPLPCGKPSGKHVVAVERGRPPMGRSGINYCSVTLQPRQLSAAA
jgi:hypothetical protein